MNDKVVSIPKRVNAVFRRRTEYTIQFGVVVTYEMDAFLFAVTAHRHGVEIIGKTPPLSSEAITIFHEVLRRAAKQHEHLKSFPLGTKQVPLDENQLKQPSMLDQQTHDDPKNEKDTVIQT